MFLEHVNMSVADLDRSIGFYEQLLGLQVRWRGTTASGEPAAHIGAGGQYLALFEVGGDRAPEPAYERPGLNHFGWVVDDLEAARQRLAALNVRPHYEADYEPGRRLYFYDLDGLEVELVEYDNQPIRNPGGTS